MARIIRVYRHLPPGCDCTRPTFDTIAATGFRPVDVLHTEMSGAPSFLRPLVRGIALAPLEQPVHAVR
jgi:hypothetical protein